MIVLRITERVKPIPVPAPWVPPVSHLPHSGSSFANELYKEIKRKDDIIKALVKDFKHKVGDTVEPAKEEALAEWGKCKIMNICSEYIHLGKDFEWPKNDNPMIITASSEAGEIFYATTNYFKDA